MKPYLVMTVLTMTAISCRPPQGRDDQVTYRGQIIQLSKAYATYEDYKNDPDNIAPSENDHVASLVEEAPIESAYASREAMVHDVVFNLQFPGYGLTSFPEWSQSDGSTLTAFSIEVPRAEKDRLLVFRGRDGRFTLLDDFMVKSDSLITDIAQEDGKLVFSTVDGKKVLERPVKR